MSVVVVEDCGYEACGGDVPNTDWSYSRVCVEEDDLLGIFAACTGLELLSSSGEVTGTIGFGDDTYDQDVSFSVTAEFDVPAACKIVACAQLGGVLALAGLSDASCADAGTGCNCTGTLLGTTTASDSDYATDGDTLSLNDVESTYCASDDSFKYTGEIEGVPFVYETVPQ
jgi:hypothetical protein